jgi:putative membrane protein
MKPTTQTSFALGRRALLASAVAILVSAGAAFAQSTSSGSSSYGSSSPDTSRRNQPSSTDTSSSGSSYGTGSSRTDTSSTAGAPTGRMSSDKLSWGDRHFVNKAADSGNDEIALAKLAAEKANNSEVKSFAQKLVDDHSMVASELQTLASQKNVKIDQDMDKDRAYKRLSKKSGSDFDQEFVEHMIDEHEKDIKMFEKAASDAKDPDVRSFASKHVDHLKQHLQEAQSLRQTIMPTGRTEDTTRRGTTGTRSSSTDTSRESSGTYSSGSSSSGTTGTSSESGSSTTPKRDGTR